MHGRTCAATSSDGPGSAGLAPQAKLRGTAASYPPNPRARRALWALPRRHCGPFLPRHGLQIPPDNGLQDYALARGHANHGHDSGNGSASFPGTWISCFGIPFTVTSDRGAQFTSAVWQSALSRLGINVSATTAYHPQSNGIVERFHRTLKNVLRCAVRSSKLWTRSLPWVLLGIRSAPKIDMATSTAEVLFGAPLHIPGLCFQNEQSTKRSAAEQLELARTNMAAFSPESLDLGRFKASPFVAKTLRTAEFVYVCAPKYTGPYKIVSKNWDNNTFLVDFGRREHVVSLSRLKAASVPSEATRRRCWGEGCCVLGDSTVPPAPKIK